MNKEQREIAELRERYPWIVKWSQMMGSYDYYIENQLLRAQATQAPATATYEKMEAGGVKTGQWSTIDDITNHETRRILGLPPLEKEGQ